MERKYGLLTKEGMVWLQTEEFQHPTDTVEGQMSLIDPMTDRSPAKSVSSMGYSSTNKKSTDESALRAPHLPLCDGAQSSYPVTFEELDDQVLSMGTCEVDGSQDRTVDSSAIAGTYIDSFSSTSLQESLDMFLSSPFFTSLSASIEKDPEYALIDTSTQHALTVVTEVSSIPHSAIQENQNDLSAVLTHTHRATQQFPPIAQLCQLDNVASLQSITIGEKLVHPVPVQFVSHAETADTRQKCPASLLTEQDSCTPEVIPKKRRKVKLPQMSQCERKRGLTAWQISKKKVQQQKTSSRSRRCRQYDGRWIRRSYSITEKIDFVDLYRNELLETASSLAEFCERHELNDKGMRTWMRDYDRLREIGMKRCKLKRLRDKKSRFPELESRLAEWIRGKQVLGHLVESTEIQSYATSLSVELRTTNFTASDSWVKGFAGRACLQLQSSQVSL